MLQFLVGSVGGRFRVLTMSSSAVGLVKLLGAIWTLEFMAFTGDGKQRRSHKQDGE